MLGSRRDQRLFLRKRPHGVHDCGDQQRITAERAHVLPGSATGSNRAFRLDLTSAYSHSGSNVEVSRESKPFTRARQRTSLVVCLSSNALVVIYFQGRASPHFRKKHLEAVFGRAPSEVCDHICFCNLLGSQRIENVRVRVRIEFDARKSWVLFFCSGRRTPEKTKKSANERKY